MILHQYLQSKLSLLHSRTVLLRSHVTVLKDEHKPNTRRERVFKKDGECEMNGKKKRARTHNAFPKGNREKEKREKGALQSVTKQSKSDAQTKPEP